MCVKSTVSFNCTVQTFLRGGFTFISNAVWSRNGVNITNNTARHTLLRTQHELGLVVTGLMVDNTTMDDNIAVYACTADGAPGDFTSNATLNVVEGMLHYYTIHII